ncbi:hypothetical protein B0H17DRAFT_1196831 [Mycena rosella]|uniref:Uncharacterized protein n=1 Tax=Mycena rosella TaxID=1033263 RepID=A0AAD7DTH9_MYCRO|nr:hypothetical protein B0H17DRAFT_1196831 [Mycena rosella]
MALSRHINAEEVTEWCKEHPHRKHTGQEGRQTLHQSCIPSEAAYQLLHDETALDGNPLLNFASFVHTWMSEHANKLITENLRSI